MIRVLKSEDLKTDVDNVCTSCGRDHTNKGYELYVEGIDFVFETDDDYPNDENSEWCICMECKAKFDSEQL